MNKNLTLIFYLTQTSISYSLIQINEENWKEIYSKTEVFDYIKQEDFFKNLDEIINGFYKVIVQYININNLVYDFDIHLFVDEPIIQNRSFQITDDRKDFFVPDEKYFEDKMNNIGHITEQENVISPLIFSIFANDYFINLNDVLNKKIQKIDLNILDAVWANRTEKRIEGIFLKYFVNSDIFFHSSLIAIISEISAMEDLPNDFNILIFTDQVINLIEINNLKVNQIINFHGIKEQLRNEYDKKYNGDFDYLFSLWQNNMLDKEQKKQFHEINKKIQTKILREWNIKTDYQDDKKIIEPTFIITNYSNTFFEYNFNFIHNPFFLSYDYSLIFLPFFISHLWLKLVDNS